MRARRKKDCAMAKLESQWPSCLGAMSDNDEANTRSRDVQ